MNNVKEKARYEKVWEGTDLFGFDVIELCVYWGKKYSYWRLFINRNYGA
jgi:hypothetical protein